MSAPGHTGHTAGGSDGEPSPRRRSTRAALRWTSLAIIGKQVFQLGCALVLARILGPSSYGIISVVTIYITLTTLILDQGFSAALIQRATLTRHSPGAVATLNIVAALALSGISWLIAPLIASFFSEPAVEALLRVLALGLIAKGIAIAPRAMLSRTLDFKPIAIADITGSALGGIAGVVAVLTGADVFAVVFQVFTMDIVVAAVVLVASKGPVPNFHYRELRPLIGFSTKVFATNSIAYVSRNADNILVGRFLGVTSLSYYGMAYRVLVIPIQLIGQTVNRVMFPVFSRQAHDKDLVAANLLRATGLLAIVAVPMMALLAIAAPEIVMIVLGVEWRPTAPLLSVLAIAGARETIFYITPSLVKAMGLASLNLKFEILSTTVQLAGIIAGLPFGVLGVAVGYLIAGFVLTPVLLLIQRSVSGVSISAQLRAILPAVHAALWGSAAYFLVTLSPLPPIAVALLGGLAFVAILAMTLMIVHRRRALADLRALLSIVRPERSGPAS